jgi:hypothetical protein
MAIVAIKSVKSVSPLRKLHSATQQCDSLQEANINRVKALSHDKDGSGGKQGSRCDSTLCNSVVCGKLYCKFSTFGDRQHSPCHFHNL